MNLLAAYVSRTVLSSMLLVLALLLGLDLVFSFIGELEDIQGSYQAAQALQVVALELPFRLCDVLPVAGLIGGIVGLGLLAGQSELTVMRSSGVSNSRIVWWALRPALLLVLAGLVVSQYVVPVSHERAQAVKAIAQGQDYQRGLLSGFWHREADDFIHIRTVRPDVGLHDVTFYHLDQTGQLAAFSHAGAGESQLAGGWKLRDLREVRLTEEGSAVVHLRGDDLWQPKLTPAFLRLVTVSPEHLPLTSLYEYSRYLDSQGLEADSYRLEFWKKTLAPLATLSMVLIACTFIFGPLRSVTMGLRIVSGVLAGLGFRYLQDLFGYASLVYHFSPLVAAALPIAVCMAAGIVSLRRVR